MIPKEDLPVLYVCQVHRCRRSSVPTYVTRHYWLIAESIITPGYLVIRCPQHVTEWALRQTRYQRTTTVLEWAARCRRYGQSLPPVLSFEPRPTHYLGADRGDLMDDVPKLEDFMDQLKRYKEPRHQIPYTEESRREYWNRRKRPKRNKKGMFTTNGS